MTLPHGAFYVRHYAVAQKVALWYGDPEGPGGSVPCGVFDCPAADEDALYAWLGEADGLAAVRAAWEVVADFAREALAKYSEHTNPPNHPALPLAPTERDVAADPQPGDVVQDPNIDNYGITVRFATADRVYVDVRGGAGLGAAELHKSPSDGDYYLRANWASVVAWVTS